MSLLFLFIRACFKILVFLYSSYQTVVKYFGSNRGKNLNVSNSSIVWNSLMAKILPKSSKKTVTEYRESSRIVKYVLYPPLESAWFGCAETVEKIDGLGLGSYWIKMKNVEQHHVKVMLFIHGGGFISRHALGLDSQSVFYGVKEFNEKQSHINGVKCSHILSVDYRLLGDPSSEQIDKSTITNTIDDQLEDVYNSYKWLIEKQGIQSNNIIVAGYSAGGCLSISLVLKKLIHEENNSIKMWPIHSIALYSAPFDLSNTYTNTCDENTLVLYPALAEMIYKCVNKEERKNFSIISNIKEQDERDETLFKKLFETKWIINYSRHEEITPENDYFAQMFLEKASKMNAQEKVVVITENYQMHCYPVAHCVLPEAKNSMVTILYKAFN